jgi:hypothetical protein
LVRVVEPDRAAFVLGSTQPAPTTAVPTVRRRSGGGGVLVAPGRLVWVDIVLPRTDPWWDDDIGRAARRVGEAWAVALGRLGLAPAVHRGPLVTSPWSRSLCFAGLGPGEVCIDGRKVVGIAQRRTRDGACFQCAVPLTAPGRPSARAAGLRGTEAEAATAALARQATAVDHPAPTVLGALSTVLLMEDGGGKWGEMVDNGGPVER